MGKDVKGTATIGISVSKSNMGEAERIHHSLTANTDWNGIAAAYNRVRDTRLNRVFPVIADLVGQIGAKTILDFGCGDGQFSVLCASKVPKIINYDPAPEMRKTALAICSRFPSISIVGDLSSLELDSFDVVTMNAVWMCLPDYESCIAALRQIHFYLKPGGHLISSFTHPCFRNHVFSTFRTDFNQNDYLKNGTKFHVKIFDDSNSITVVDTHWNFSAVTEQLANTGFSVTRLYELDDSGSPSGAGVSSWVVLVARKL